MDLFLNTYVRKEGLTLISTRSIENPHTKLCNKSDTFACLRLSSVVRNPPRPPPPNNGMSYSQGGIDGWGFVDVARGNMIWMRGEGRGGLLNRIRKRGLGSAG